MWVGAAAILAKMATLEAEFMKAMQVADPYGFLPKLVRETQITTESVVITWNDLIGGMEEWIGDRTQSNLVNRSITVTPRHWQKTVIINKDHLKDDTMSLATESMQGLANIVKQDYRRRCVKKLIAGFTDLGWDNKAIFADDHPYTTEAGVAASMNNLSALNVGTPLIAAALLYFDTLHSPDGSELYIQPDTLLVAPGQRTDWELIINIPTLTGGAANPNYHRFELIVDPGMTDKYAIFACTTAPVKPVRLIERQLAEVKFDEPFLRNDYLAGVDARHDAILPTYQLLYGSTGT